MRRVRRRTRTLEAINDLLERGVEALVGEGLSLLAWQVRARVVDRAREWHVDLVVKGEAGAVTLSPGLVFTNKPTADDELDLLVWCVGYAYRRRTQRDDEED